MVRRTSDVGPQPSIFPQAQNSVFRCCKGKLFKVQPSIKPKIMKRKSLISLLTCIGLTVITLLQSAGIVMAGETPASGKFAIEITGKVTDEMGLALPGVTVTEKGKRNAVITNSSGAYRITVADNAAVLVFTFMGYNHMELAVGSKTVVNA
jgi:hypothetical protein